MASATTSAAFLTSPSTSYMVAAPTTVAQLLSNANNSTLPLIQQLTNFKNEQQQNGMVGQQLDMMGTQITEQAQCGISFCIINGERLESGRMGVLCDMMAGCSINCQIIPNTLEIQQARQGVVNQGCTIQGFSMNGVIANGNNMNSNGQPISTSNTKGNNIDNNNSNNGNSKNQQLPYPSQSSNANINAASGQIPQGINPNGITAGIICNGVSQCNINGQVVPNGQQGVLCVNGVCKVNGVTAQNCQGLTGNASCNILKLTSGTSGLPIYGFFIGVGVAMLTGF